MFQVYNDGENSIPSHQLQHEQVSVSLVASAAYGGTQSVLMEARKELYASNQRCRDLEMSLFLKEEALEDRDECLMYTREQLKKSQKECEQLKSQLSGSPTSNSNEFQPEVRRLQRDLSMQGEIRFWRTRYAELCNKYGEQGVSYRSGAMDAAFLGWE